MMRFQRKYVTRLLPLVLACVLVLYPQRSARGKRRAKHSATPKQSTYYQYTQGVVDDGKCRLYNIPENFDDGLLLQKISTFPLSNGESASFCLSMNESCSVFRNKASGVWVYHCLPLLKCTHPEIVYVNKSLYTVLTQKFDTPEDLIFFLNKENYISELSVYARCSGRHHDVELRDECVKFQVLPSVASWTANETKPVVFQPGKPVSTAPLDIQVVYIHFISRQQFKAWLPTTLRTLTLLTRYSVGDIFDFQKFQSGFSSDFAFLRTFLYGRNLEGRRSLDVLETARARGFTTRVFDLTCHSSERRAALFEAVQCANHTVKNNCLNSYFAVKSVPGACSSDRFVTIPSPVVDYALFKENRPNQHSLTLSFISLADIRTREDLNALDLLLSALVSSRFRSPNSVTMLISDVGYIFTKPSSVTTFDHLHLSNPVLFLAVSSRVELALSDKARINLAENQKRLISMFDLHQTLLAFLEIGANVQHYYLSQSKKRLLISSQDHSLFDPLPLNRTCESLSVSAPNLCICQDQAVNFKNDTIQVAYAEFIVGWLNNKYRQWHAEESLKDRIFFQGIQFFSPKLSSHGDSMMFSSFLVVGKYRTAPRHSFLGCVAMQATCEWHCTRNRKCRVTRLYHVFVEPQTAVFSHALQHCNHTLQKHFYHIQNEFPRLITIRTAFLKHFGSNQRQFDIYDGCLFLIISDFIKSVTFSVLNVCDGARFSLTFNLILREMVSLTELPLMEEDIKPNQLRFLSSVVQTSYFVSNRSLRYTAQVKRLQ